MKSDSGIYHVMLRGVNRQQIFKDEEDCERFIQIIKDCKKISEFKLYAYCLMENHIHLLLKVEKEPIEQIFKRIGSRFVYWYNIKYQRTGHLFQDRYKSEPVENDSYFLSVVRYIHCNPVKAGICKNAREYKYSSYRDYVNNQDTVEYESVFKLLTKDEFIKFNDADDSNKYLDISDEAPVKRVTDQQAKYIIEKYCHCKSAAEFRQLNVTMREKYVKELKKNGLSIRQIGRLTGIGKGTIEGLVKG